MRRKSPWPLRTVAGHVMSLISKLSAPSRKPSKSLKTPPQAYLSPMQAGIIVPVEEAVTTLAFATRTLHLAYGTSRGKVALRDLHTLKTILIGIGQQGVTSVSWSPDGQFLASAHRDGKVLVWDIATCRPWFAYTRHQGEVRVVAWSPDGSRLASAGEDTVVRIWTVGNGGSTMECCQEHLGMIRSLAWSPDGSCLLSGGQDGLICLWNPDTGRTLERYKGHQRAVTALSWCPGNQRCLFASASDDGTVRVWHTLERACLYIYTNHAQPKGTGRVGVAACAWSADGQRIISADWHKTVQEWSAPVLANDTLVSIITSLPFAAHCFPDGRLHCLAIRPISWSGSEQGSLMALGGDGWLSIGLSPAEPVVMGDDVGGRRLPLSHAMLVGQK